MARIVSYSTSDGFRHGLVIDGMIHKLTGGIFGAGSLTPGEEMMPYENAQILPPVQPSKIVCVGRNYAAHAAEHNADVPTEPMIFLKPPSALISPGAAIELPPDAGRIDHEAELVIVIGQRIRHATRDNALDAVLGYTCANDVSARAYQKKDGQWGRAKGFDTFCPLGPWIVTELDPSDLAIRCTVNDTVRQDSRTSNMVFDVRALITFISGVMTLEPGDIILTGTPAGVSPLSPGDVVRVEIEGIGTLENSVREAD